MGLETLGLKITLRILGVKKQDVRSKTHSCPGFLSISFSNREKQLSKSKVWEAKGIYTKPSEYGSGVCLVKLREAQQ